MSALVTAWALLALGVTVTALVRVRSGRPTVPPLRQREVIVLRPLDAPSAAELENLAAPLPPGFRHIVLSPTRPRVPVHVEWLPSDPLSQNRKLGHLQYALDVLARSPREAHDEVAFQGAALERVLLIDSDVRVDEALLASLLGALDGGADAAWAAPLPESPGPTRGVLVQSLHAFEVLTAISLAPAPLCGKAVALGRAALDVFRGLPDCVGEDLELAARLHERGLRLELAGSARMPGPSSGALSRFTRWMQVLHAHRPWSFPAVPLLFACTPVLLALAVWAHDPLAWAAVGSVVIARAGVAARAEQKHAQPRFLGWWLAGEALLLIAWCCALWLGDRVQWRGRQLLLGSGGRLIAGALGARR